MILAEAARYSNTAGSVRIVGPRRPYDAAMHHLGMGKKNNGEKNPSPLDLSSLEGWGATWSKRGTSCPNPLARHGSWSGPDGERTRWKGNNGRDLQRGWARGSAEAQSSSSRPPGSIQGLSNRPDHPSPKAIEMYRKCAIHHGPGAWLRNNRVETILHVELSKCGDLLMALCRQRQP